MVTGQGDVTVRGLMLVADLVRTSDSIEADDGDMVLTLMWTGEGGQW